MRVWEVAEVAAFRERMETPPGSGRSRSLLTSKKEGATRSEGPRGGVLCPIRRRRYLRYLRYESVRWAEARVSRRARRRPSSAGSPRIREWRRVIVADPDPGVRLYAAGSRAGRRGRRIASSAGTGLCGVDTAVPGVGRAAGRCLRSVLSLAGLPAEGCGYERFGFRNRKSQSGNPTGRAGRGAAHPTPPPSHLRQVRIELSFA